MDIYKIGETILVPDGYYKNGKSRPWRKATITNFHGKFIKFTYKGKTTTGYCPRYGVKKNVD